LPYYDVVLARDAIEALDLLESGARVDAVVCGRDEPAIDGEPLRVRIARAFPQLAQRTVLLEELSRIDFDSLKDAVDRRLAAEAESGRGQASAV
jgi:hypothetical protein